MPLAGLLGLGELPPRFQSSWILTLVLLPGWLRPALRPWAAGATLVLLMSLGPWPRWEFEAPRWAGPWAWVSWAWPPGRRLHHPVRAVLLALPVCSVVLACLLTPLLRDKLRSVSALLLGLLLSAGHWEELEQATSYLQPSTPPYAERTLPGQGAVVDLLGMPGRSALGLQTFHQRPIREPLWFRRGSTSLDQTLQALSEGASWPEEFSMTLAELGFTHLIIFPRQSSPLNERILQQAEEALGTTTSTKQYL